jgi:hypothetical protein
MKDEWLSCEPWTLDFEEEYPVAVEELTLTPTPQLYNNGFG